MSYFDLLCRRDYFDIFLDYFNHCYDQVGQYREKHYHEVINRHRAGTASLSALIDSDEYTDDVYQALSKEFGMARVGLVSLDEFRKSIREHAQILARTAGHNMDEFCASRSLPAWLLADLEQLFRGLVVTQPKVKRRLVAVSKTLHFLLPDLVMPVDNAVVLRFLGQRSIPKDTEKQFELFTSVFAKYMELAARLGMERSNSDGRWWNISVPKRIDNAVSGLWTVFSDRHIEHLICNHTDVLLNHLAEQLVSSNAAFVACAPAVIHQNQVVPPSQLSGKAVRRIKQQLADRYISDPEEKCVFLKTEDNNIHGWGCYIAGLVLTKKGKAWFGKSDITSELKTLIPDYGEKYLRESMVIPSDVCYDSKYVQYPCLEANRSQKPYRYRFLGFKIAITKALGSSRLQQMLRDC